MTKYLRIFTSYKNQRVLVSRIFFRQSVCYIRSVLTNITILLFINKWIYFITLLIIWERARKLYTRMKTWGLIIFSRVDVG